MNPGDWVGRRILCIGGQFLSGWRLSEGNIGARLRQIEIDQERDHLLVDRGQRWGRGAVFVPAEKLGHGFVR